MILENSTLIESVLSAYAKDADLTDEDCAALEICRKQVVADEKLLRQFHELGELVFSDKKFDTPLFQEINEFNCCFRMLVALNWIPRIKEVFRKNSWSLTALRDTMSDIGVWARHCRKNYGFHGLHKWGSCIWFRGHGNGTLIQLGRLQFNIGSSYIHPVSLYRNRISGEVIALATDGSCFDKNGFLASSAENTAWEAVFTESTGAVSGYPVSPDGLGKNELVTLDLAQWNRVIGYGDKVLNFHIPECGPMTIEACRDSVEQAVKFFAEFYPDFPWKAIYVSSWFNDPVYEKYLPSTSNIVKFHTAGYLLPEADFADPLARVFPGTEPHDHGSSLQKAVYRMIQEKVPFRRGTLVLLKEDLPWRENVYRKG